MKEIEAYLPSSTHRDHVADVIAVLKASQAPRRAVT